MRSLYLLSFLLFTGAVTAQNCLEKGAVPLGTGEFTLTVLGTYSTGVFDAGAAEIVTFDSLSGRLFFTNAAASSVSILDISDPAAPRLIAEVVPDVAGLDGVNSVAAAGGRIAAAFQGEQADSPGTLVVMDTNGVVQATFPTGALPDMVTFSPDGRYILTANEGEPNDAYDVDPEGSVTVVDLLGGLDGATVTTVGFTDFNRQRARLAMAGVRLFGPGATVAQDLEPEYITVQGNYAYVSLQENNAFAILDLEALRFTDIVPFGVKDLSCPANALDASNRDGGINLATYPVLGLYQPDAIASFQLDGETYLVTANEGDARDYDGYSEEARVGDLLLDPEAYPNAAELQDDAVLGRLLSTTATGDVDCDGDIDQVYSYGARSFSIFGTDGRLVFDSGNDFERILAELEPDNFNSNNDENDSFDSRSDDKGPEPEAVEVIVRGDRRYALIGLERIGGVMVYDISDPTAPYFVSYTNNRDFSVAATVAVDGEERTNPAVGDLGIEDVLYISADYSPTGQDLVVTANEVSGTITLFALDQSTAVPLLDLAEHDLRLYPNPFRHQLRLGFELAAATDATVDLLDITGRSVLTVYEGHLPAGSQQLTARTRDLPVGTYLLRLRFGDRVATRRVVHQ